MHKDGGWKTYYSVLDDLDDFPFSWLNALQAALAIKYDFLQWDAVVWDGVLGSEFHTCHLHLLCPGLPIVSGILRGVQAFLLSQNGKMKLKTHGLAVEQFHISRRSVEN